MTRFNAQAVVGPKNYQKLCPNDKKLTWNFGKNRDFVQKCEVEIPNFGFKSKFRSKIEIVSTNQNYGYNFCQESTFRSKLMGIFLHLFSFIPRCLDFLNQFLYINFILHTNFWFFAPILFYTKMFGLSTPILYYTKIFDFFGTNFIFHQNFCFFYTKIFVFFYTKIFVFFTPKFFFFLHQILKNSPKTASVEKFNISKTVKIFVWFNVTINQKSFVSNVPKVRKTMGHFVRTQTPGS